jgi:putative transposase
VLTEGHGIPLAVAIDGANRHDMTLTCVTLKGIIVLRPAPTSETPQGLCLDAGCDSDAVRAIAEELDFTPHIRPRGEEAEVIVRHPNAKPRRWVVERTHS